MSACFEFGDAIIDDAPGRRRRLGAFLAALHRQPLQVVETVEKRVIDRVDLGSMSPGTARSTNSMGRRRRASNAALTAYPRRWRSAIRQRVMTRSACGRERQTERRAVGVMTMGPTSIRALL